MPRDDLSTLGALLDSSRPVVGILSELGWPYYRRADVYETMKAAKNAGLVVVESRGIRSAPAEWALTESGRAWVGIGEKRKIPPPRKPLVVGQPELSEVEWDVLDTLGAGPVPKAEIVIETGRTKTQIDKVRKRLVDLGLVAQVGEHAPRVPLWGLTARGIEANARNPLARKEGT